MVEEWQKRFYGGFDVTKPFISINIKILVAKLTLYGLLLLDYFENRAIFPILRPKLICIRSLNFMVLVVLKALN